MTSLRRSAVITPVRGRLDHLVNQRRFLDAVAPGVQHVVVAIDMPDLRADLETRGAWSEDVSVVPVADDPLGMPTAAARNAGARAALEAGADLLVFLDVDCAPLDGFVGAFEQAAERLGDGAVFNGVVTYLPQMRRLDEQTPSSAARFVEPHPARPAPSAGALEVDDAHHLLWSLAFGVKASAWKATGGFDERYVGYGAEDTDFGLRARHAGLRMAWVGGAQALHQWHPSANPPVHHVVDIVRNATLYFERWGAWPMEGWLCAFAEEGLVEWTQTSLLVVKSR